MFKFIALERHFYECFLPRIIVLSFLLVTAPSLKANEESSPDMSSQHLAYYFSEDYSLKIELGVGFNWFDYFGSGGYYARWKKYPLNEKLYPGSNDTAAWNELFEGMDALNPGWIRFGLPPHPHVDTNGRPLFNTEHIERLSRLDAWATQRDKTIILDFFTMPSFYEFPVPEGTVVGGSEIINMAAEDNHAYATNFVAPFLKKLVVDMDLRSIQYFNPINEPMAYGVYQTPNNKPHAMVHYVDMYREIRKALDAEGVTRERLKLVGLDSTKPTSHLFEMHALGVDIDPYADVYALHHYNIRLDYWPAKYTDDSGLRMFDVGINGIIEREDREILNYCRLRGKSLWAGNGFVLQRQVQQPFRCCKLGDRFSGIRGNDTRFKHGDFCVLSLVVDEY